MEKGFTIHVLDHGFVRYVDHMGTDMRVVEAARVSYQSASKGEEADKKLLGYLWKNKHTSPFEMLKLTLDIKMPIFIARQYIRHRMQSVNEMSARYTELPQEFYIPKIWRVQDTKNKQGSVSEFAFNPPITTSRAVRDFGMAWQYPSLTDALISTCEHCYIVYQEMIKAGVAREMARMVLPLNIYTQFYATWDMKNLLHFITLRDDAHAQAEIQEYGKAIKQICTELFPWTMEAYSRYKWVVQETTTDL